MIRLLRDCFDKSGNRYKAISFNGDKYQCQSYSTGKMYYFAVNEISASPPRPENRIRFNELVKKKEEAVAASLAKEQNPEIAAPPVTSTLEPVYEEPDYSIPDYDYGIDESEKVVVSKDNVEETAGDFYADF